MGAGDGTGAERHVDTRLTATLLSGDRLFPVTVTEISEDGFAAEGASLDALGEEFLFEMTLPPVGEPAWSPKAVARTGAVARVRAQARAQFAAHDDTGESGAGLRGRFEAMSDSCRSLLHAWMVRWSADRHPINKGAAPRGL